MIAHIQIIDYPGKKYSSIRIDALKFIGLLDRSADKRFGLATGKTMPSGERLVLYLCDGAIRWKLTDCAPFQIRFFVDGWGCFTSPEICVFNQDGIVFRAEMPSGFTSVRDVQLFGDKIIFYSERFIFTYNWLGDLIEQARDESRLYVDNMPDMLRWDRLTKAEELLPAARVGIASATNNAERLLNICLRQFGDHPTAKGKCYRFLGELALLAGNEQQAMKHWRAALKTDKNAGVKRQLQALEKKATI